MSISFFNLFQKRPSDVYFPKERLIFRYFDGTKIVPGDPMVLYKRLMQVGPELSIHIKVSRSTSKDAMKAHDSVVSNIRDIFKVKSLEEGGLGETECAELLDTFLEYCDTVKKNSKLSPTPSTPTVDSTISSPAGQPITNSSDSGSTGAASDTDGHIPSQPGQPSPSAC